MKEEQLDKAIKALENALETIKKQERLIEILKAQNALITTPIIIPNPYPLYLHYPRSIWF